MFLFHTQYTKCQIYSCSKYPYPKYQKPHTFENSSAMTEESESSETSKYTQEQKIIAAVWVHERFYNNQTWNDVNRNFRARFNVAPPMRATLLNWEKKLFSQGNVEDKEKSGRPLARLMHVPYVKASLEESPDLSLRERAKILGLPRTTLLKILREDLNMEFEVEDEGHSGESTKRHVPYNNGRWKKKRNEEEPSTSVDKLEDVTSE